MYQSADLQFELFSHFLGKKVLIEQKCETKFRRESLDCSSPYLHSGSIWGSEHTLFPSIVSNMDIPREPLGSSQANGFTFTENLSLECRNVKENLKYI